MWMVILLLSHEILIEMRKLNILISPINKILHNTYAKTATEKMSA